ncbi:MAG: potassium-transporting ATPase subunit KdpB [Thermoguttaceae bacterium]|nr:potassium-transporting ATPase subunit KdpB [Thermoguttaceae bacterium]
MSRKKSRKTTIFDPALMRVALRQSFIMLNPVRMARNPVMFVTEMGAILTTFVWLAERFSFYNGAVSLILWATLLFANFAEALAEARGKAQADSLKESRKTTPTHLVSPSGEVHSISSDELKAGDVVLVLAGEMIPGDGEVIEGIASVDESAITGESAPVVREAGTDFSGVTGGTKVLSDEIKVRITAEAGESFLDRMIGLVEGAVRQKTPNELALTVTLAGLTLGFLLVAATLYPIACYFDVVIPLPTLIALLVCLIPTTIGALLAAIGLAGMDRALAANVMAKSGKAVELAGDIDTLLLDKTGTITVGNRQASEFYPVNGVTTEELMIASMQASFGDATSEGKSILELGKKRLKEKSPISNRSGRIIEFSAQTRLSGIDFEGYEYRKGAYDAVISQAEFIPSDLSPIVESIACRGSTPLVIMENRKILGAVALSDTLKVGIQDRFARLRAMGLRVVMVTGDNPLTAKAIAQEAGVDDFIAEARPEDKLDYIRREQSNGRLVAMMGDGTNDAPALAQADIGIAMNSGTQAAKEAGNMVDLDSDPTKLIEIIEIGKQLLMTRGALTTFSIANDMAKYFAILPAIFVLAIPELSVLNIMGLSTPASAILSALIFNAIIIPILIPIALRGVKYRPMGARAIAH